MIIQKFRWVIALVIVLVFICLAVHFFQPIFLRRSFIDSVGQNMRLDVPQTAQIVEYRFGINSFGVEPFLVKLELNQEQYDILARNFSVNEVQTHRFNHIKKALDYESHVIDNIAEVGWRYSMTAKYSLFLNMGATRVYEALIIETIYGEYFLYMFY